MTIYFSTNIPELRTMNVFNTASNQVAKSTERLSTGLRINSGADDAIGFAIRESLRADIKINEAQAGALASAEGKAKIAVGSYSQALTVLEGSIDNDTKGMLGYITSLIAKYGTAGDPSADEIATFDDMIASLNSAIGSARYDGASIWGTSSSVQIGQDESGAAQNLSITYTATSGIAVPTTLTGNASLATALGAVQTAIDVAKNESVKIGAKLNILSLAKDQFASVDVVKREAEGAISNVDAGLEGSRLSRASLLAQNAMNAISFSRQFAQLVASGAFA